MEDTAKTARRRDDPGLKLRAILRGSDTPTAARFNSWRGTSGAKPAGGGIQRAGRPAVAKPFRRRSASCGGWKDHASGRNGG